MTEFQDIKDAAVAEMESYRARRQKPKVYIYDGNGMLMGLGNGYIEADFGENEIEPYEGKLVLPGTHYLAGWLLDNRKTPKNVLVRAENCGHRFTGLASSIVGEGADGGSTITLTIPDDKNLLNGVIIRSNPFLPASVQFPKYFSLIGPSRYMLKLALFLNIARQEMNLWTIPDDPLDPRTWLDGVQPWDWQYMVIPSSLVLDNTRPCVITSRWKTWTEMATPIMIDKKLRLTYRRWFQGDPAPYPGCLVAREGQCFFDIVETDTIEGQTSINGGIAQGLIREAVAIADNFVDEVFSDVTDSSEPIESRLPGAWGLVGRHAPWVNFRACHLEKYSYTVKPGTAVSVSTGGKSMPGVNEAIGAFIKMGFNVAGSIFFMPTLGDTINDMVKNFYSDIFLAFDNIKSPFRTKQLGWIHNEELFVSTDQANTLGALDAIRQGFWDSRSTETITCDIRDGAPYLVGGEGWGDLALGDRVGVQVEQWMTHSIVQRVTSVSWSDSRENGLRWSVTVGNPNADVSPIRQLQQRVARVGEAIKAIGIG